MVLLKLILSRHVRINTTNSANPANQSKAWKATLVSKQYKFQQNICKIIHWNQKNKTQTNRNADVAKKRLNFRSTWFRQVRRDCTLKRADVSIDIKIYGKLTIFVNVILYI